MTRMTPIEPPQWAPQPSLRTGGFFTVADYRAILQHRDKLLALVHRQVEAYVNDPQLMFDGATEWFPNRQQLSGAYYIGGESYFGHRDSAGIEIAIACNCLRRPYPGMDRETDYLELTVWLKCMPGQWATFEIAGNTDSAVI